MKTYTKVIAAVMLALTLTSCASWNRQDTGMLAGGVVGGVAGNVLTGGSAVGTGVGALGGAFVGREMSR